MNDFQVNNHSPVVKLVKKDSVATTADQTNFSVDRVNGSSDSVKNEKRTDSGQSTSVKQINDLQNDAANTESSDSLGQAVTKLNEFVQSTQRDLQFKLDEASGKTVITVLDRKTQEVIRQIPDDEALKLAQALHQDEPLTLFNAKV